MAPPAPRFGRMSAIDSVASPSLTRPTRLDRGSLPLEVVVVAVLEVTVAMALMFDVISRQSSSGGTYVEAAEEVVSLQPTDARPSKPMFVPKEASTGYFGPFTLQMASTAAAVATARI